MHPKFYGFSLTEQMITAGWKEMSTRRHASDYLWAF